MFPQNVSSFLLINGESTHVYHKVTGSLCVGGNNSKKLTSTVQTIIILSNTIINDKEKRQQTCVNYLDKACVFRWPPAILLKTLMLCFNFNECHMTGLALIGS